MVKDQLFTFDGYSSSSLNSIFSCDDLCFQNSYIESIAELTIESMSSANKQYRVIYKNKSSYNNECIFVFGGQDADSDVVCFNLTNSTANCRLSRSDSLLIVDETSGDEFIYYTTSGTTPSLYNLIY